MRGIIFIFLACIALLFAASAVTVDLEIYSDVCEMQIQEKGVDGAQVLDCESSITELTKADLVIDFNQENYQDLTSIYYTDEVFTMIKDDIRLKGEISLSKFI